ncbi:MAG: SDR family oxidoreductase [Proteobacteria bacterium]|nr:SDR family oxidoreductase [Pseudomonadota bacterium]
MTQASFDFAGRVAVVTGAAGILGSRLTAGLLGAGAAVAAFDLPGAPLEALAAAHRTAGARLSCVAADVADAASVRAAVASVESGPGPIDMLFNNAGSKGPDLARFLAPFESYDLETWRAVMSVNLDGMFLMAQAVGSRMAARGAGAIVQTSSIFGVVAPDQRVYAGSEYMGMQISSPAVYAASKAGVIGLTRHLAAYWGAKGVRVNAISPGGIESGQNETFQRAYGARVPLGRMAEVDEIVQAALFLASDGARYMTGQNLVVDGGLSVW